MIIGIIGYGVVGQAIGQAFKMQGHAIRWYDKHKSESESLELLIDSDYIFVCVPTNTVNHTSDISNVVDTVDVLDSLNYQGLIIIKSTVLPGTTQQLIDQHPTLKIVFVPEFLHQNSALYDFLYSTNSLIIGTDSDSNFELAALLHQPFCQSVIKISTTEAELVKYFVNNFNSLRVVFANAYYEVCKQLGADYNNVLTSAVTIPAIDNDHYLKCNENLRGYNGKCLPKDIEAFNIFVKSLNLPITIFDAVIKDNDNYTDN
jgi:UDPglucose 6-dehydrogenase